MNMKFLAVLFLLLSAQLGNGQKTMSLSEAIDYAMSNHADVRIAQLNVRDAEWQIKENRATALPSINLGVNYSYFIQQPGLPLEALGLEGMPGQRLTFALRSEERRVGKSVDLGRR